MKLPEIVLQKPTLHYLAIPLKATNTKTSSALTGPISSVVPSGRRIPELNGSRRRIAPKTLPDDSCTSSEGPWSNEATTDSWPTVLSTPSTIYKDFGNGLCFCNTNIPSNTCECPYDFPSQDSGLEKDFVSEDILMEFLQDLEIPDNQASELDIEMVDLGDLSDFLDELAKE